MDRLAADSRAVRGGEEHDAGGDLAGLGGPAHGTRKRLLGLVVHGGRDERGPDGSRGDGVDADALADELVAEAAREGDDGALGRRVVQQVGAADVGVDAGVVDDGGAPLHVREGVLGQVEEGVDVGVEGVEPLVPKSVSYIVYLGHLLRIISRNETGQLTRSARVCRS